MRPNILFLTYWYPTPTNRSFGIFVKRHAQALSLNHKITVLAFLIKPGKHLFKKSTVVFKDELGVETHQILLESKFNKLLYVLLPLHYFILKNYITTTALSKRIAVIHSNVLFPAGIIGYKLSKNLNCKHIITEHWTRIEKFFRISVYRFIAQKALDKAHAITCVSVFLANTVSKYTSNTSISIIPNVIDAKKLFYNPEIKKNDIYTFIAIASWGGHKNPFYFTEALQLLYNEKRIGQFKLVLVGTGPLLTKIKTAGYTFPIEYIDHLEQEQLCLALNQSHIFLHGSDYETFSVVIAEALTCGLPSVVSPVGIALEVINKKNGYVAYNNVLDWKDKILKCYHSSYNNKEIAEMLKNKYDLKTIGTLFDELYNHYL